MERGMDRSAVAQVGAIVFAWALLVPALAGATTHDRVMAAGIVGSDVLAVIDIPVTPATSSVALRAVPSSLRDLADVPTLSAVAVRGFASSAVVDGPARTNAVAAPPRRAEPPPEALVRDGIVIASWYGPRFYGNKTACGQTYTPEILGVAHRILKCGTLITITSPKGVVLTVPVIDRGPFIAGRALDLSNATRLALQCSDLCRVHMKVLE